MIYYINGIINDLVGTERCKLKSIAIILIYLHRNERSQSHANLMCTVGVPQHSYFVFVGSLKQINQTNGIRIFVYSIYVAAYLLPRAFILEQESECAFFIATKPV